MTGVRIGQHADAGVMTGGDFALAGGFWVGSSTFCLGDLDGDNQIGLADLQILLSNYGQSGTACDDGDLDQDGDVDRADLQALLGSYGDTC